VVATHFDENAYHALPPAEPLHEAFLYRQQPLPTLPADFTPLDVTLGESIHLLGYRMAAQGVEIGQETAVTIAWQPINDLPIPLSLFAHIVGADGNLIAQDDRAAQPQEAGLTLTQFWLTPRPGTMPGPHTIGVGAYSSAPLLNGNGEARTAVATLPIHANSHPPYTTNPLHRPLADGSRTLIGYDWDTTLPGQKRLYLHWQTAEGFVTELRDNVAPAAVALPPFTGAWGIPRTHWALHKGWENGRYIPLGQGLVWLDGN
jgi:hypothetical protein